MCDNGPGPTSAYANDPVGSVGQHPALCMIILPARCSGLRGATCMVKLGSSASCWTSHSAIREPSRVAPFKSADATLPFLRLCPIALNARQILVCTRYTTELSCLWTYRASATQDRLIRTGDTA